MFSILIPVNAQGARPGLLKRIPDIEPIANIDISMAHQAIEEDHLFGTGSRSKPNRSPPVRPTRPDSAHHDALNVSKGFFHHF